MSFRRRAPLRALTVVPLALLVGFWAGCAGEYPQSTFRPATDLAVQINDLFAGIFWWTMLVTAIVFGVLAYVLVRFRDRPGAQPRKIYGNNLAEIGWTLGPAVIVVFILVPTVRMIFHTYREAPPDALVVEAVGHQWWWEFRYPQLGVATANQLHLPVGRPIDVRLSSADVLHNWWVPRLGGKRYNYPVSVSAQGEAEPELHKRLTFTINEAGEYSGQCAEFCGLSHALMRMLVVADDEQAFQGWVQAMKAPPTAVPAPGTIEERGWTVFQRNGCIACHTIAGTPAAGVLGPNLTRVGARWAVGAGLLPNTPENMERWIRNSGAVKPGSKMPPFQYLGDEDMAALVAYLQSLK